MHEKKLQWFIDRLPKATKECPYYRPMLLVMEFYGYGQKTCTEDYERNENNVN